MELTKEHRNALLLKLDRAKEEKENTQSSINRMQKKKGLEDYDSDMIEYWNIDLFLLSNRIKLIEQSIIDNEIDF